MIYIFIMYNLYATYNYFANWDVCLCVCVCQGFWDHGVQVAYKSYVTVDFI